MKKRAYYKVAQNNVLELTFRSKKKYEDPFNENELFFIFLTPNGDELRIPAFWAGGDIWKVRYASHLMGKHKFIAESSNSDDSGLNGNEGIVEVVKYKGENDLYKHGPLKISSDNKHLEHLDGKPFFWLGETWAFGTVKRFKWPEYFKFLTKDRVNKGFNVIMMFAGMQGEIDIFDPKGSNEAGWPWNEDLKSINPEYFNLVDLRINHLVKCGLIPCITGSQGYYIKWLGIERMKKYWNYIVSRWGAYPVVWVIAWEARLPHYSTFIYTNNEMIINEKLMTEQVRAWAEVCNYVKSIDPYKRLLTVHPSPGDSSFSSRDIFSDPKLFDFDMLQTGNFYMYSIDRSIKTLNESLKSKPTKPVINGDIMWEGMCDSNWPDSQRFAFWSHMLSGTAGHSYAAQGVWDFSTEEELFIGFDGSWAMKTWKEGYKMPGSYQIGIGKKFLERFKWYNFESHPEWIEPHSNDMDFLLPYAAGIPREIRIIYLPSMGFVKDRYILKKTKILHIEKDINYKAYYFNPRNGEIINKMDVKPDKDGSWLVPVSAPYGLTAFPSMEDWVLVLEKINI